MPRKKHNIHYIYKITCNVTGKYYIGMHSTSDENDGYMGSGKRLKYSIKKYGKDAHIKTILEYCENREKLIEKEIEIVNTELLKDTLCMNLKEGGNGGSDFKHINEKGLNNKSNQCFLGGKANALKLINDSEYANRQKKWAIENGKKMFELGYFKPLDWTNKKHSEESKNKMQKSKNVGKANSQFGTIWITNGKDIKKIKKEQLNEYEILNWKKGRTIK